MLIIFYVLDYIRTQYIYIFIKCKIYNAICNYILQMFAKINIPKLSNQFIYKLHFYINPFIFIMLRS